jgi:type IX secretion system PorP/SprF family membrane protein
MFKYLQIALFIALHIHSSAQQDAMFTKYHFNALSYNPAYAGSQEALSIVALHRHQWIGIKGAPLTQTLTVHTPLHNDKVALGLSLGRDQIGRNTTYDIYSNYAYRIPINGGKSRLAFGLMAGVTNYQANFNQDTEFDLYDDFDQSFIANPTPNYWMFNVGAGMYYQAPKWFVGISAPFLLNNDLRREGFTPNQVKWAQQYRHYFVTTGFVVKLNQHVDFRPIFLWKNVGMFAERNQNDERVGAPNEIDIDLSFLFNKSLWVGAAFRTALEQSSSFDSVDFWMQYIFYNSGLRIGLAYDYALTPLQGPSGGSYEVMVGYNFDYKTDKIVTPRYF